MVGDILQPTHLLFVLVIALLVLGPKRLPEVGRAIGDGLRDFRSAINGEAHPRDELDHESFDPDSDDEPKHEFAAATQAQAPAHDHEFATQTQTPGPAEDHVFTHDEPAANGHEIAGGDPATAEVVAAEPSARPHPHTDGIPAPGQHEFAHESSSPAQPRDKPLS